MIQLSNQFLSISIGTLLFASVATAEQPNAISFLMDDMRHGSAIPVSELFKQRSTLDMKVKAAGSDNVERMGNQWQISGESPLKVSFVPAGKNVWDVSGFRLVGVSILNQDSGVTTIDGRLNNSNLTSWSHHAVGFAVAPFKESATLGFPFPVPLDRYKGPAVFDHQWTKPNGHRSHWRQFYPEDVRELTLNIKSSTGKIDLLIDDPFLAWPANAKLDAALQKMPYLDEFGQVRAVDWPGKAADIKDIRKGLHQEFRLAAKLSKIGMTNTEPTALAAGFEDAINYPATPEASAYGSRDVQVPSFQAKTRRLSQYGGWLDGPKKKATGHFRTQKIDGKWWLVDPEGYLFFSVGVSMAGHKSETPMNQQRQDANFFAYVPGDDDYLRWSGRKKQGGKEFLHFPAMNYQRALGKDWKERSRDGIHSRMRAWGVNTLGAWSDEALQRDGRTPYTLIASIWWGRGYGTFPTPFEAGFEDQLRAALAKYSWAKDDPYCMGVFIGNELGWPDNGKFTATVFELDENDLTIDWIQEQLQKKYASVADLNKAWKTEFANWSEVFRKKPNPIPQAAKEDFEPLYQEFASIYFRKCRSVFDEVMPNKLYLGCRTVRSVEALGRAAAGHVDVFSANCYENQIRPWEVPIDVDIPILISEFHFGAADRGVPSPGLSASWDQRQRGLAFAHYLASALADPRFVGVHWFQWIDQSAAGRWDRENHQIGFVDVTGRAYPVFVNAVSDATAAMYSARTSGDLSTEQILEAMTEE